MAKNRTETDREKMFKALDEACIRGITLSDIKEITGVEDIRKLDQDIMDYIFTRDTITLAELLDCLGHKTELALEMVKKLQTTTKKLEQEIKSTLGIIKRLETIEKFGNEDIKQTAR